MKKIIFLAGIILFPVLLMAHPASEIKLTVNNENKNLEVTVIHDSKDIRKHFIDQISVYLNGEKIIAQVMLSQENSEKQTALYHIADAKSGDLIQVEAKCSIFGKKKSELKIEE